MMCASFASSASSGRLSEHALQASQNGEGQDDAPVLRLFEVTAQEIREGPDICGELGGVGRHVVAVGALFCREHESPGYLLGAGHFLDHSIGRAPSRQC